MSSSTTLPPLPAYTLQPLPPVCPGIPDKYFTLFLPIIAYWAVSLFFHVIDEYDLCPQYRLHTPAELLKRNHVSRRDVFRDVILQQIIQTIFGLVLAVIEDDAQMGKEDYDIAVWAQRIRLAQRALPTFLALVGLDAHLIAKNMAVSHPSIAGFLGGGNYQLLQETASGTVPTFASWELLAAKAIYWFLVPAAQFVFAILVVDTWQYFFHRAMHVNKWLYTTLHSRHHRLYVPYAYGALYNHPFEGFWLDTLGTGVGYLLAGLTCRQSMWFFTCSTIKTVDDHCGYALPFDPIQHITSNNAGYHDIHHQSWGIKTNYSQPFFTFWDRILGTMWTGGDVSARYEKTRIAAQGKVDKHTASQASAGDTISHTRPSDSLSADLGPYAEEEANADPAVKEIHVSTLPRIPPGKASYQALGSRQQVVDDASQPGGGFGVLREEADEEREAQRNLRRSPRKKVSTSASFAPMMELRDRVNTSLHGKGSAVLGVESSR